MGVPPPGKYHPSINTTSEWPLNFIDCIFLLFLIQPTLHAASWKPARQSLVVEVVPGSSAGSVQYVQPHERL